jgi:hypothetical protein
VSATPLPSVLPKLANDTVRQASDTGVLFFHCRAGL